MKNFYADLLHKLKERESLALAAIVEAKGSTPQVPGALALFSSEGLVEGTLGGGLLEADAQNKALNALKKKESILYMFNLKANTFLEEEPICGGDVRILIDASPDDHRDTFDSVGCSLDQRRAGILATVIHKLNEEKIYLLRYWIEDGEKFETGPAKKFSSFKKKIKKVLSEGKPRLLELKEKMYSGIENEGLLFLEPVFPLSHLVIAGAGHVGQAVAHLGSLLNFEVTVIDDRPEFANKGRLPDADHIIVCDFSKALQNFSISSDTYLVIVTRGHQHDFTVLKQCVSSEAGYIGMIGSSRKIALLRKTFLVEGWATPRQFDRVHAPIGLPIHSKTVEEIAVSIAAQLVQVRYKVKNKRKARE